MIIVTPTVAGRSTHHIPRGQSFFIHDDNTLTIKDGDGNDFIAYHPDHWSSVEMRPDNNTE